MSRSVVELRQLIRQRARHIADLASQLTDAWLQTADESAWPYRGGSSRSRVRGADPTAAAAGARDLRHVRAALRRTERSLRDVEQRLERIHAELENCWQETDPEAQERLAVLRAAAEITD